MGHAPRAAFYLLPTRAWELLLGAVVASVGGFAWVPGGLKRGARGTALVAVIAPLFLYDAATPFPGRYALVPAFGAATLIALGGEERSVVDRVLTSRPLVGLGLISYSAYLWHQPLFVLVRYGTLDDQGAAWGLGLCLVGLALAYVTWRWVERPFRDRGRMPRRTLVGVSGV